MQDSFYEVIFNTAPFAVMVTDAEGHYVDVNQAAVDLLGAPYDEIIGKRVVDFVSLNREPTTGHLWNKFRDDKKQTGTFIISRPDGTERIIKYVAFYDFLPGKHVSYAFDTHNIQF